MQTQTQTTPTAQPSAPAQPDQTAPAPQPQPHHGTAATTDAAPAAQPAANAPTQATSTSPSAPDAPTVQPTNETDSDSQSQQGRAEDSQSQPKQAGQPAQTAQAVQTVQAQPQTPTLAPTAAPQSAPAAQATQAAQAALPTRYGVSLQHAVEAVRTTVELGARAGATQARIELSPASLGTIRIQLHRTDEGVTAHVVTDSAATADTLSQGGDDLRRSLQSAGVNLISLSIEARGESGAPAQDRFQDSSPRSHSGARATETDAIGEIDSSQTQTTTTVLPEGTLVNVLA
jgi:flagellar hook-length control protein FliK